jgi:surface carbohydrate biosynthesis protein
MSLSQGFTPQENEINRKAIYNALKSLKDVQLVIKLHPSEDQKAAQYRKDTSLKPTIVRGWGAFTFELLNASDVVITHYCTTAIEAIILKKPVIVMDFSGKFIWAPYVECGAAIGVHRADALASIIERMLYDEEARQKLEEMQQRYVCKSGFLQNGQASQIVADLVTQMGEESKQEKYQ